MYNICSQTYRQSNINFVQFKSIFFFKINSHFISFEKSLQPELTPEIIKNQIETKTCKVNLLAMKKKKKTRFLISQKKQARTQIPSFQHSTYPIFKFLSEVAINRKEFISFIL